MQRRVLFEPWPGPWYNWAHRYCRNNFWRIQAVVGSMDDALAECALQFVECKRRYGAMVDQPQWLMALYKRCVMSRFNDLSVKDSHYRETIDTTIVNENGLNMIEEIIGQQDIHSFKPFSPTRFAAKTEFYAHSGAKKSPKRYKQTIAYACGDVEMTMDVLLKDASPELGRVLTVLFNAPTSQLQQFSENCNTSKKFFRKIASSLGISTLKSDSIVKELHTLLH